MYNNNNACRTIAANRRETSTVHGNPYLSISTLQGTMTPPSTGLHPISAWGWSNPAHQNKGWGMTTDIGVLFQGSPKTTLVATCTGSSLLRRYSRLRFQQRTPVCKAHLSSFQILAGGFGRDILSVADPVWRMPYSQRDAGRKYCPFLIPLLHRSSNIPQVFQFLQSWWLTTNYIQSGPVK